MDKTKLLEIAKTNSIRPSIEKTVDMIYSLKGVPIISEVERCHMVRALLWSMGFELRVCIPLAEEIVDDLPPNYMAGRSPSLDIDLEQCNSISDPMPKSIFESLLEDGSKNKVVYPSK